MDLVKAGLLFFRECRLKKKIDSLRATPILIQEHNIIFMSSAVATQVGVLVWPFLKVGGYL